MSGRRLTLAGGLLLGAVLDSALGDPRRGHPVAVFGAAAGRLERRLYADSRGRGALFTAACVGGAAAIGALAPRRVPFIAVAAWTVLGGRSLRAEASVMADLLAADDLPAARRRVTHLVGRDPERLEAEDLARATVESIAENTCDAVVAPLFWGAVGGVPGLLGYRAANTLDAMVGHRSTHYERFGWASARLDDVLNYIPARLTAAVVTTVAPVVGGDARTVARIVSRDGRRHPSPNSGMSEAAFAAALGLLLGGRTAYGGRVEDRPVLGDGLRPTAADLPRAARLCAAVTAGATAVISVVSALGHRR